MLEAFRKHAFNPESQSQRPLFHRACCWHRCVLQTLTIGKAIGLRSRAEMQRCEVSGLF